MSAAELVRNVRPTDRHGNAVPFSPYPDEVLEDWQRIVDHAVTMTVAFDGDAVTMGSTFGSGERVPIREAAQVALDLSAARCARTLGNDQVYGQPSVWGQVKDQPIPSSPTTNAADIARERRDDRHVVAASGEARGSGDG